MWKPGRGAYYPVDRNGVVTAMYVMDRDEENEVVSFVGELTGRPYRGGTKTRHVLAWRRPDDISFTLYTWFQGQQERIGKVKVEDVLFGLTTASYL